LWLGQSVTAVWLYCTRWHQDEQHDGPATGGWWSRQSRRVTRHNHDRRWTGTERRSRNQLTVVTRHKQPRPTLLPSSHEQFTTMLTTQCRARRQGCICTEVKKMKWNVNYLRQGGYVLPAVCLSVCQQLCIITTENRWSYLGESFTRDAINRTNWLNFGNYSPLDPDLGIFLNDSSTLQVRVFVA